MADKANRAKIAVIGTGWWATTAHIPSLKENPRAEIVLVDKNPAALKAAAEKYGIKNTFTFTSLAEAVGKHPDLRGAIVAVPHQAHYAVGKKCLNTGCT